MPAPHCLAQWLSTRVPWDPGVPKVTARGFARSYTNSLSSNWPYLLIEWRMFRQFSIHRRSYIFFLSELLPSINLLYWHWGFLNTLFNNNERCKNDTAYVHVQIFLQLVFLKKSVHELFSNYLAIILLSLLLSTEYSFLHKMRQTLGLLHRDSSSSWNVSSGFRTSEKVENYWPSESEYRLSDRHSENRITRPLTLKK